MRAVVIGGNGFIGSHLVDGFVAAGWRVTVFDVAPSRYRKPPAGVESVTASLGDTGMLEQVLPRTDVVFHLASTTIPQSSNDAPDYDIRSNLLDTVKLLEKCVQHKVGRVVFLSSGGTVYGVPRHLPVTEEHPTDPICSYGIVKLAIEKYLHLYHELHRLPYTVLRPANPFGPWQNPAGRQGAIAVFLGRIARGQPLRIWGDGEVVRDFFYVEDLVRACLGAAVSAHHAGVYNLGSGRGISLNELLAAIEQVVDRPVRVERLPARSFDVPTVYLDIGRARQQLDWQPTVPLHEGLRQTWEWVSKLEWVPSDSG